MNLNSFNLKKHGDPTCLHISEELVDFGLEDISQLLEFYKFFQIGNKKT